MTILTSYHSRSDMAALLDLIFHRGELMMKTGSLVCNRPERAGIGETRAKVAELAAAYPKGTDWSPATLDVMAGKLNVTQQCVRYHLQGLGLKAMGPKKPKKPHR